MTVVRVVTVGPARRVAHWAHSHGLRRWLPDGNPLRRRSDRAEAAILAGLLAAFLVGAPVAAVAAGQWAGAAGLRAQRAQASWRQVPAVLVRSAPGPAQARSNASQEPLVRARWSAPDGARRSGEVYAPPGARAGTTELVWTDSAGHLTGMPVQPATVAAQIAESAVAATVALALALALIALVTRRIIDRRRLTAWDTHWSVTEPHWSGRR